MVLEGRRIAAAAAFCVISVLSSSCLGATASALEARRPLFSSTSGPGGAAPAVDVGDEVVDDNPFYLHVDVDHHDLRGVDRLRSLRPEQGSPDSFLSLSQLADSEGQRGSCSAPAPRAPPQPLQPVAPRFLGKLRAASVPSDLSTIFEQTVVPSAVAGQLLGAPAPSPGRPLSAIGRSRSASENSMGLSVSLCRRGKSGDPDTSESDLDEEDGNSCGRAPCSFDGAASTASASGAAGTVSQSSSQQSMSDFLRRSVASTKAAVGGLRGGSVDGDDEMSSQVADEASPTGSFADLELDEDGTSEAATSINSTALSRSYQSLFNDDLQRAIFNEHEAGTSHDPLSSPWSNAVAPTSCLARHVLAEAASGSSTPGGYSSAHSNSPPSSRYGTKEAPSPRRIAQAVPMSTSPRLRHQRRETGPSTSASAGVEESSPSSSQSVLSGGALHNTLKDDEDEELELQRGREDGLRGSSSSLRRLGGDGRGATRERGLGAAGGGRGSSTDEIRLPAGEEDSTTYKLDLPRGSANISRLSEVLDGTAASITGNYDYVHTLANYTSGDDVCPNNPSSTRAPGGSSTSSSRAPATVDHASSSVSNLLSSSLRSLFGLHHRGAWSSTAEPLRPAEGAVVGNKIASLVEELRLAKNVLVILGAGASAESGISTFQNTKQKLFSLQTKPHMNLDRHGAHGDLLHRNKMTPTSSRGRTDVYSYRAEVLASFELVEIDRQALLQEHKKSRDKRLTRFLYTSLVEHDDVSRSPPATPTPGEAPSSFIFRRRGPSRGDEYRTPMKAYLLAEQASSPPSSPASDGYETPPGAYDVDFQSPRRQGTEAERRRAKSQTDERPELQSSSSKSGSRRNDPSSLLELLSPHKQPRMWLSYEDMLTIWNANADDNPFPLGFRQFEQYRAICTLFFEKMVQTYRQAQAHDGYLQLREVLAHWKKHENFREQDDLQHVDEPAHLQEVRIQPTKKSKKLVVATTNLDQLASAVFGDVATEVVPMHGNIDRTRFHGYRVRDVRACDRKVLGPFAFPGSSVSAVRSAAAHSCDAEASTALEMKQIEEEASFYNEYRNLPVVAKPEVLHFSESYNPPFTNLFGLLHAGDLFGERAADHHAQEAAARAPKPGSCDCEQDEQQNGLAVAPAGSSSPTWEEVEHTGSSAFSQPSSVVSSKSKSSSSANAGGRAIEEERLVVVEIGCSELVRVVPDLRSSLLCTKRSPTSKESCPPPRHVHYFRVNPTACGGSSPLLRRTARRGRAASRSSSARLEKIPLTFSAFGEKLVAAWNKATARDDGDTDEAEGAGRPQFHCPVKEYALRVQ